jgi:hypothetical protein
MACTYAHATVDADEWTCTNCRRRTCGFTVEYPGGSELRFCGEACYRGHSEAHPPDEGK